MSPLAKKLLRLIFGLYFVVAVLVTSVQLFAEFSSERDSLFSEVRESVELIMPALTAATWDLDEEIVAEILRALNRNQAVTGLRLVGDIEMIEGEMEVTSSRGASAWADKIYKQSHPINYIDSKGETQTIGYLYVYSDAQIVFTRVESVFYALIISALIKTFSLWLILYFTINLMVAQPLRNLSKRVADFSDGFASQSGKDIGVERKAQSGDELTALFLSFVRMRRTLKKSYAALLDKQMELSRKAREANSANAAKSEFLANISHELRTPMHAILSFAKIGFCKSAEFDVGDSCKYFDKIKISGDRLLVLLDNLLDLSKLDSNRDELQLHNMSVNHLLRTAVSEIQSDIVDAKLVCELRELDPDVHCLVDFPRCLQALRSLLDNAVKFSPEGGSIRIFAQCAENAVSSHQFVAVSIEDEGPGIPPDEAEIIFEAFTQSSKTKTKAGGTGLGLAISRHIVKQHGGQLWADTSRKKGTRLVIELPLAGITSEAA